MLHGAGEGTLRAPFDPPASRDPIRLAAERAAFAALVTGDAQVTDHRTAVVRARVTPAEHADWQAKAAAAGVSPSRLLRQAMARTRTWTAAAAEVERERTRQVARIGNNLNQIARWANTEATAIDAVEIIANLVYISQTLDKVARVARMADDATERITGPCQQGTRPNRP